MYDTTDPIYWGQATDDGAYDDVETYGPDGTALAGPGDGMTFAFVIVAASLAALWVMGAFVFKGSNQS